MININIRKILQPASIVVTLITIFLATVLVLSPRSSEATVGDACNSIINYEKNNDYSDFRVNINFESSDNQIDVSANSGYEVIEVWLDVENDGHMGFHKYANGPVNNFNPNPGNDIDKVRVYVKRVCPSPTPTNTPTPTPTPTNTPTPTPTPTPVDECGKECEEPEVTPTPTPTQEPRQPDYWDCSMNNSCERKPEPPVCRDGQVLQLPANFHVLRKDGTAILKWNPTGGSEVNVFYKENNQTNWTHALGDQKNNGYIEINNLNPSLGYTFGLMQKNGCAGSETVTAVVIDPPAKNWTLFNLSFWTWN